MDKRKQYAKPALAAKYEPPVLLDLDKFIAVAGACGTGGGSCS
jgi:hypothetical protein